MKPIHLLVLVLIASVYSESEFRPPTPPPANSAYIAESFGEGWKDRWIISKDSEYDGSIDVVPGKEPYGEASESSLTLLDQEKRHAISSVLSKPLDNTGKTLIVQYELRAQNGWTCGGGYLKLFSKADTAYDPTSLNGKTPYSVMFGPDKCGGEPNIHFIFNHVDPKTGKIEEKHLNPRPYSRKDDTLTHLYTLIVEPDNTFRILVDREEISQGSLLENFNPPVNPPKEINDPEDQKPSDWVDLILIPDPEAKKPEDWVEVAMIPDPNAVKPEDWDDEADGDWERPMIRNPEYKGEWTPPKIPNPEYKGEWKPRQIPNPNYYEDKTPYIFQKIVAVGLELLTVDGLMSFDNILVTSDIKESEAWADSWTIKHDQEMAIKAKNDPDAGIQKYIQMALAYANDNPIVTGIVGGISILGLLGVLVLLFSSGGKKPKTVKEKEESSDDDADETEKEETKKEESKETKPKVEVTKRRSQKASKE